MRRFAGPVLIVLMLLLAGLSAGCFGPGTGEESPAAGGQAGRQGPGFKLYPAVVTRVVDGDTAYVDLSGGGEEKVRFTGVDTPESTREIEPYGKKASAYTEKRLQGEKVWLETGVEERDQYGRLLAYIWTEKPDSDSRQEVRSKMFNAELLLEGYAQLMTVPPNVKYVDYFETFQHAARRSGRGLWGLEVKDAEKYYVGSKNSDKFHRPGCRWAGEIAADNLLKFDSRDEAYDAGYEPCGWCNP